MSHQVAASRYANSHFYRTCGRSGVKLPLLSLGLWHNFGANDDAANTRALILRAFDSGITHFDLANNYGPPTGTAEMTLGRVVRDDLSTHRDELIVATKAGFPNWAGPYGTGASRKHLLASLDHSLRRLGLDYVDIFYSHRPDPDTPPEETAGTLAHMVRTGKALYVGLSNYGPDQTSRCAQLLRELGTPCLTQQSHYSMLERKPEQGLFDVLLREGIGCVVYSPLEKGLLTNRYFSGLPADARAVRDPRFLKPEQITQALLEKTRKLEALAQARDQSLAQFALAWVLRHPAVTTAVIGASKVSQIEDNLSALKNLSFTATELSQVDHILAS